MSWTTLKTEKLLDTYYVKLLRNEVQLPDGAVIPDFYSVTIPDAAMICALTKDGKVILNRQFRYCCNEEVIECPAGMFNEGETDPLEVAKRELLEETGYASEEWIYLGYTWESTAKLTNKMHLFIAKDCEKVGEQRLDENERIEFFTVPLAEALQMVMNGEINANSTAHLILKAEKCLH